MTPDEFYDSCHAAIDASWKGDSDFKVDLDTVLAATLISSVKLENSGISAALTLVHLREWYGTRVERLSVLATLRGIPGIDTGTCRAIARAAWSVHSCDSDQRAQCSLHSVGYMWAMGRLDEGGPTDWLTDALCCLLRGHPLRSWSLHLLPCVANWARRGMMSSEAAVELVLAGVESGLAEHLANNEHLGESWQSLVSVASPADKAKLRVAGNRIIAAGKTAIIPHHLSLLNAMAGVSSYQINCDPTQRGGTSEDPQGVE